MRDSTAKVLELTVKENGHIILRDSMRVLKTDLLYKLYIPGFTVHYQDMLVRYGVIEWRHLYLEYRAELHEL